MAQVVGYLPSNHEALSSSLNTEKKKKESNKARPALPYHESGLLQEHLVPASSLPFHTEMASSASHMHSLHPLST
jgi:hypothetical protein